MQGTYLGIRTPNSKVKDPRGEARSAMAVAGVARLKLGGYSEVTNLFDHVEFSPRFRGMQTVLSVWMM